MEPAWLTHGALSHPLPFFFSAFPSSPPLLLLSAALGSWKQPSCLSLRDGSLPSPAPPGTGGEQLLRQCWRRRIRCAGMEQPVPVSQQRFNLPLAYKQQMSVQLTCKQAACVAVRPRSLAPHSAALCFLPSSRGVVQEDGAGDQGTAMSSLLEAPQAWWLEAESDAQRDPILHSRCCIPSAPMSITAGVQNSRASQA